MLLSAEPPRNEKRCGGGHLRMSTTWKAVSFCVNTTEWLLQEGPKKQVNKMTHAVDVGQLFPSTMMVLSQWVHV